MTYKELISTIEKVASQQPNIRTIVPFSPYDVNKSKETEYSVFSWSPNAFIESNEFINYSLKILVGLRLDQVELSQKSSFITVVLEKMHKKHKITLKN